jgi:hypothetical protein
MRLLLLFLECSLLLLTLQNLRFALWTLFLHVIYFHFLRLLVGWSTHHIELMIVLRRGLPTYPLLLMWLVVFIVVGLLARGRLPLKSLRLRYSLILFAWQRRVPVLDRGWVCAVVRR